jgi:hypothetical protein
MEKYINRVVVMIYVDGRSRFTKRRVRIHSVSGSYVRGYCYDHKGFRTFKQENILAVLPASLAG